MKRQFIIMIACGAAALAIIAGIISYSDFTDSETVPIPDIIRYNEEIRYIQENTNNSYRTIDGQIYNAEIDIAHELVDGDTEKTIEMVQMWHEEYVKIFENFRSQDMYKKFKEKYPNSTDRYTTYPIPSVSIRHIDASENHIILIMNLIDNDIQYVIACSTDRNIHFGGSGDLAADYLENNVCIQYVYNIDG